MSSPFIDEKAYEAFVIEARELYKKQGLVSHGGQDSFFKLMDLYLKNQMLATLDGIYCELNDIFNEVAKIRNSL